VLFLDDPYPADDWILTFVFRLLYGDMRINVDRVKRMETAPDAAQMADYRYVFRFTNWKLERLR
jgi:hypothetical protein